MADLLRVLSNRNWGFPVARTSRDAAETIEDIQRETLAQMCGASATPMMNPAVLVAGAILTAGFIFILPFAVALLAGGVMA